MKRLSTIMMCLFAMMAASLSAKAQEITFLMRPGWNWIAYPYPESVSVETAFGDFEPTPGDVIESEFGYSEYFGGYGWFGGIQNLEPGKGYMYYSNRTEVVSFVFGETAPQLTVTTAEPTDITATSAISGGSITSNDGNYIYVFMKGICWATHPNPMVMNDSYTENGSGAESFTAEMTDLTPNTVYYVRAYAVTQNGTIYGDELSYITVSGCYGNHCYVDLGLPSGLLWATCNVGATEPEEYGVYFAWGETQSKSNYDWSTYQYCNGSANTLNKYCNDSNYGYNGFTDNLTILLPEDDAATANWGSGWRMPTKEEWQELLDNTTVTWTQQNGVNGRLFTASNGNTLFFPAAGFCIGSRLYNVGMGYYWSSSLYTGSPNKARGLDFDSGYCGMYYRDRNYGQSIRPVRSSTQK